MAPNPFDSTPNALLRNAAGSRQEAEQNSTRASRSQSRPASNYRATNPYRELWRTGSQPYSQPDLIDLGTPFESVSGSTSHGQDEQGHRYYYASSGNGNAVPNHKIEEHSTQDRSVRHQFSLIDLDESVPAPEPQIRQLICAQCDRHTSDLAYCNICQYVFCSECWSRQITHRKNQLAPGSIPHEKTNYDDAQIIKVVLESDVTEAQQEQMHGKDENSTWFGILRERGEFPVFQDYGRYAEIMSEIARETHGIQDTRFPGMVSFVGQTGAGKSTLIKLIIDLNTKPPDEFASPIVGSVKNQDVPTSGDVHLYIDPKTFSADNPILYADCEGLEGGEREPVSARFKKINQKSTGIGHVSSFERKTKKKIKHTSERLITWANTSKKRSREFAVTHLYPRLLYTFSDVVVFVLKNPRTIESVFEKLVDWAAAALEKSSNQPVLPHAIIVLNACDNSTEKGLWDIDIATQRMLDSLSQTIWQNDKFKTYALFWRERQRQVDSVEQLLLSYYSSLRVVRIPTNGRPNLICTQIHKLYQCIEDACRQSRDTKRDLRMLLDADELQPYLQAAFDHFAEDLDTPFDFVQAAFINSPIPMDFGGNILKLAISIMDAWENIADGPIIFTELSYMVASCIMVDSARHGIKGTAEQIFPPYIEHLDAALENFCDRHWPCEFVKGGSNGGRCVNVRSGHGSKGHQLKNGKVLAVGNYMSHFSFDLYRETFQYQVYIRLSELLQKLLKRTQSSRDPERDAAAVIHRENVLRYFFPHSKRSDADTYISHSACFSCLFEPPEHGLPCGHVICTKCLRDFRSRVHARIAIEIDKCPICEQDLGGWRVILTPEFAGVRILTLDGGGIRGIVELEILRQIEVAANNISINSFFDLIVGTSTGGIIALGLAAKNWSVQECTQNFQEFCNRAFTARTGTSIPGIGWFIENFNHSKYETQPLQEALVEAYSEEEYLFGGARSQDLSGANVRVAVVSTSISGSSIVLANYNRICRKKLSYQFQRPENLSAELKIWEVARATSAAPKLFKPMCHEASKQTYTDGGIYHNNPIYIAEQERKLIWPHLADDPPDIILSIGTSYNSSSIPRKALQNHSAIRRGIINHKKQLIKIAVDHIAATLDCERVWNEWLGIRNPLTKDKHRYVRCNPDLKQNPPNLDEVDKLRSLQETIRNQIKDDQRIRQIALQLIATSFYFEKSSQIEALSDESYECRGHIFCRLLTGSSDMERLGKYMKFLATKSDLYFLIQEENRSELAQKLIMPLDVLEIMVRARKFTMKVVTVKLSNRMAVSEILLYLKPNHIYPISRFPRSLLLDDDLKNRSRLSTLATNTNRWAGRSNSQHNSHKWTAPDLKSYPTQLETLASYSSPEYKIGGSSANYLTSSSIRLSRGDAVPIPFPTIQGDTVPVLWQASPSEPPSCSEDVSPIRQTSPSELPGDTYFDHLNNGPEVDLLDIYDAN